MQSRSIVTCCMSSSSSKGFSSVLNTYSKFAGKSFSQTLTCTDADCRANIIGVNRMKRFLKGLQNWTDRLILKGESLFKTIKTIHYTCLGFLFDINATVGVLDSYGEHGLVAHCDAFNDVTFKEKIHSVGKHVGSGY